jgi:LuxR family transcriptional regulator, maltose regulon positive regulatory protein
MARAPATTRSSWPRRRAASRAERALDTPERLDYGRVSPPEPRVTASADPIIQTKLEVPVRRKLVSRESLLASLVDGQTPRRLTLVRAPAGWGKTTLLAEWSASALESRPFAWLALDRADNDPAQFWRYAITALRSVTPGIGERPLALLRAPGVDLAREMLPLLINELGALQGRAVLVLDDYHLIEATAIHEQMALLIDHLPAALEVVLISRTEPPLPLARLRARGELVEVDAAQLGFSSDEVAQLANGVHGLGLDARDLTRLRERTEGWAAGLYLAVLSLGGRGDRGEFISRFAGDDRHVVDYLGAEVLAEQPAEVREFLLHTSVAERLCAPLCDAITRRHDSARLLGEIERSNLFLLPLDTKREWYRYHHLFGELLRHELALAEPGLVPELHRRAAAWLLDAGLVSDGIRHTIEAGDLTAAGELIAVHWAPTLLGAAGDRTVDAWLSSLPAETLCADVRLCFARCFTALSLGRMDEVEEWLAHGERAPQPGPFLDGVRSVQGALACVRAAYLWETGDSGGAMQAGHEAKEAEAGSPWEAIGVAVIGLAHTARGEWRDGRAWMTEYARIGCESGHHLNHCSGLSTTSACLAELGDWEAAERTAETALEIAGRHGIDEHWCTSHAHLARGLALDRRGEHDAADVALERSVELARRGSGPIYTAWPLLHLVAVQAGRGDRALARARLEEARDELATAPDGGIMPVRLAEVERRLTGPARPAAEGEPLSERELTVLRLLASELSQRDIGRELYLSLNTVKTHARRIFGKLGVSSRAQAVERGRELGLL